MILFAPIYRRQAEWARFPNAARGYFSGQQDPGGATGDGLLLVAAAAAVRLIKVFVEIGEDLGPCVATTVSAADGSWLVGDLPSDDRYTIMALDYTRAYATLVLRGRAPYV